MILHSFSILSVIPFFPNLSALRSFRVLRPLKSVSKLPGLRKIIKALVESAADLSSVMLLLAFLITCFSITGMLFWNGILHARCRLTPFPVKLSEGCGNIGNSCWDEYIQNVTTEPERYRCLQDENDNPGLTQSTSPWFVLGPQDCIWPIDVGDERICSLNKRGQHTCPPLYIDTGKIIRRTCGSNYDVFGNPRFVNTQHPYGYPRMKSGTFNEALNWGFTNYDSFLPAFITTFQAITLEGWTDVMYQIIDAWSLAPTVAIFCTQVILCGYIVLNLVLAVITKSLDEFDDANNEEEHDCGKLEVIPEEDESLEEERQTEVNVQSCNDEATDTYAVCNSFLHDAVGSKTHSVFIMVCIVLNTAVLSIDHYGISDESTRYLETMNTIFTAIFIIDVILCNVAFGAKTYWR